MSNPRLAVVTTTRNRAHLLPRLYESLQAQTYLDFEWWVADDQSTDATGSLIAAYREKSQFPIYYIKSELNSGKSANLNRVFEASDAGFYLVIDSDEVLLPTALATVAKKVARYAKSEVGAIFFRYIMGDGSIIGPHYSDIDFVTSRAIHDSAHGKYDGSVGYYRRVTEQFRYPVFPGESYVGPTVLQLQMAPRFTMAFTAEVIAIAEYQEDGLTHAGRRLRIGNPQGMAYYCRLQRLQAAKRLWRLKFAIMEDAYKRLAQNGDSTNDRPGTLTLPNLGSSMLIALLGRLLMLYWNARFHPEVSRLG